MSFMDSLDDLHESQRLEFKDAAGDLPDDVWETYSAMANTEGGEIVLGVHEDISTRTFSIEGVVDPHALTTAFWNTLRNPQKVERDVMLSDGVRTVQVHGKDLIIIEVPKAERGEKPVKVYDRKKKQFAAWIRRGEGDYRANEDDLRLMDYDRVPGADRKALEQLDMSALCDETIERYRNIFSVRKPQHPWNADSKEDFLFHIGAAARLREGKLCPTQAGLIAFGYEYEITNYLPGFLLDYREETSGAVRWDDRIVSQSGEWSGNALDFYLQACNRLARFFKTPFSTDASGMVHGAGNRVGEALNEVVANALIHADYGASSNAGIRIVLKEDSLVARNPGTLLIEHDVAIAGGYSESRNPTLMRIFNFIGASDRAGSGLGMVYRTWYDQFGEHPVLAEEHGPSAVTLTLPVSGSSTAMQAHGEKLSRKYLLGLFGERRSALTVKDVQEITGASERVAQKALKSLHDKNLLVRVKQGRSWAYSLKS